MTLTDPVDQFDLYSTVYERGILVIRGWVTPYHLTSAGGERGRFHAGLLNDFKTDRYKS